MSNKKYFRVINPDRISFERDLEYLAPYGENGGGEGVILKRREDGGHLVFRYDEVEVSKYRMPRDNELNAAWEEWKEPGGHLKGSLGFEEDFIDGFLPGVEFGDEEVDELANYVYERSFDLGYVVEE